ncbi:MAG: PKD domain-containing protein [Candidatus Bathyarchaeota archaeon]|nr:PKD domain-containing protein [Candidatus Bathyarchaeum sp.]
MRKTKGIVLTLLVCSMMTLGTFTCTTFAAENSPTVWVTVHRIQAIETSEYDSRWKYSITVDDQVTSPVTQEFTDEQTGDDITINNKESFEVENQDVYIILTVLRKQNGDYRTADISSLGKTFDCTYNLATNEVGGEESDETEDGYYVISGEDDGTLTENDATVWFTITDNYDAPVAHAGSDQRVGVDEQVIFDASKSTASEGSSIVKYAWDFNDDGSIDSNKQGPSYTFTQNGNYTCKLTVTDSLGATSEDTCIIQVTNKIPIAQFTFNPENPSIHDPINLTDQSYDKDGTITAWIWEFGDGTNSTEQNPTHTFNEKKEWKITLTVTDNEGAKNSTIQTVIMSNLEPEACFGCNTTRFEIDTKIQFLDNSTDPENKVTSWFWDFGDGNSSDVQSPIHTYTELGDYNVTLTIRDDENATNTYTMAISVVEHDDGSAILWILAIAAIVVAAVVLVGLFWRSRKQKSFPEMFTGSKDPAI